MSKGRRCIRRNDHRQGHHHASQPFGWFQIEVRCIDSDVMARFGDGDLWTEYQQMCSQDWRCLYLSLNLLGCIARFLNGEVVANELYGPFAIKKVNWGHADLVPDIRARDRGFTRPHPATVTAKARRGRSGVSHCLLCTSPPTTVIHGRRVDSRPTRPLAQSYTYHTIRTYAKRNLDHGGSHDAQPGTA